MKVLLIFLIVLVQAAANANIQPIEYTNIPTGGPNVLSIDELTTDGLLITTASTTDVNFGIISYTLVQHPISEIIKFAIDGDTGQIYTTYMFDYEDTTDREYNLTIWATTNSSPDTTESLLTVRITDVDDTAPVISGSLSVNVQEGAAQGYGLPFLYTVNDVDSTTLSYALSGESAGGFDVSPSGQVWLWTELDYEEGPLTYNVALEVSDGAIPPHVTTATLTLSVLDVNDNPPSFGKPMYSATLDENSAAGILVSDVVATDVDTIGQVLRYTITEGDISRFTISESEIHTSDVPLDYETQNFYTLTVMVSDGKHESVTVVEVQVLDLNEPPEWGTFFPASTDEKTYSVTSGSTIGATVLTAAATDPDNQGIYFTVASITGASGNPEQGLFVIDITGKLTMEATPAETVYDVIIEATDFGSPALSIVRMVKIKITQDEQPPTTYIGNLGGVCISDEDCLYPKGKAHCKVNNTAAAGSTGTCECYEQYYVQALNTDGTRDICHRPKCTSKQVKTCTSCQQNFYKSGRNRCLACDPGYGTEAAGMTGEAACIPMANVPTTTTEQCYDLESCQTCMDGVTLALEVRDICTVYNDGVMHCLTSCPSVYMQIMKKKYFAIDSTWSTTSFTNYAAFSTAAQDLCNGAA